MRPHVRRHAIVLAVVIAAFAASPAHAGTVTTPNACLYLSVEEYRNQPVTLSGSGSPAGAPAGATATLSGASLSATLPLSLPQQGYETGIFDPGYNAIPSRVWVALAATNAVPATQVRELSVTASTTITVEGPDKNFVSGTPIVVTIPIPDTTWTVAASGPVTFSQAGPGTLPNLPVGLSDKIVPVSGSIVVKPTLRGPRFVLDCQPGSTAAPFKSVTPAVAAPFATLESAYALPQPPPGPLASKPSSVGRAGAKLRIASTKLKRRSGRIAIAIACPGPSACKGRVSVRTLAKVRLGTRRRFVAMAARRSYTVPAGRQRTTRILLSAGARRLLRTRRKVRVRVTLDPSRGNNVSRNLTLDR